jgi:hypothetical protein
MVTFLDLETIGEKKNSRYFIQQSKIGAMGKKIAINPKTIDKTDIIQYFLEMTQIAFCIENIVS